MDAMKGIATSGLKAPSWNSDFQLVSFICVVHGSIGTSDLKSVGITVGVLLLACLVYRRDGPDDHTLHQVKCNVMKMANV